MGPGRTAREPPVKLSNRGDVCLQGAPEPQARVCAIAILVLKKKQRRRNIPPEAPNGQTEQTDAFSRKCAALAGQTGSAIFHQRMNSRISAPAQAIRNRQLPSGGWSFDRSRQASIECTCLNALALSWIADRSANEAVSFLLKTQLKNGAWPAFEGDAEPSWVTALALCTAIITNQMPNAPERAVRWLLSERGKESHWFWRWKFKTVDRNARFNPDQYGWPWIPDTCSWVIPTAFSLIALKQFTVCSRHEDSERRIRLGVEMLLDRACVDGGWNAGNSVVYGVPLRPHVEATAIALLALQDEGRNEVVEKSLAWLQRQASTIDSLSSLSWTILSLFTYQVSIQQLQDRLSSLAGDGESVGNNATLATALLALRCGEMIHPFMVLR